MLQKRRGEQFYSTFDSRPISLPRSFRSPDFVQGREAIIGAQPRRWVGTWNNRLAQLIGDAARFVDAAAPHLLLRALRSLRSLSIAEPSL